MRDTLPLRSTMVCLVMAVLCGMCSSEPESGTTKRVGDAAPSPAMVDAPVARGADAQGGGAGTRTSALAVDGGATTGTAGVLGSGGTSAAAGVTGSGQGSSARGGTGGLATSTSRASGGTGGLASSGSRAGGVAGSPSSTSQSSSGGAGGATSRSDASTNRRDAAVADTPPAVTVDAGGSDPCQAAGLKWRTGAKTNYTSYPDPNSEECIKYSGCEYEGLFSACSSKRTQEWVQAHNIVAVFPDFDQLKLHDLCLRSGGKTIVVTVLDQCADSDCSGCCTENRGKADQLIDIESYTDTRWGIEDGAIEWADLGPTKGSGCK